MQLQYYFDFLGNSSFCVYDGWNECWEIYANYLIMVFKNSTLTTKFVKVQIGLAKICKCTIYM